MITIIYTGNDYYLQVNNFKFDPNIAEYLDLTLEEYRNILINNGAHNGKINNECFFVNKSDAKKLQ